MLKATTTFDPVLSGFKSVSDILDGKICAGSLVFIEGESKSGKSVLIQHIAHNALKYKENSVAFYVTDCDEAELLVIWNVFR